MATTPTKDDIPSEKPVNLKFNAGKLDEEVNSDALTYVDRFDVERLTNAGRNAAFADSQSQRESDFSASQQDKEARFQQFLLSSGYVFLGDYELGPWQFSERNQYIRYNGQYWKLAASAPDNFATTGITMQSFEVDKLKLSLIEGDTLRQELASSSALSMIGGKKSKIQDANTFMERLVSGLPISLYEHVDLVDKKGSGNPMDWDWTLAFLAFRDRALSYQQFATQFGTVYRNPVAEIPAGDYTINSEVVFGDLATSTRAYERTKITIRGAGGNSTTIRAGNASTALFRLQQIGIHLSGVGFIGFGGENSKNELLTLGTLDGNNPFSQGTIEDVTCRYGHKNLLMHHAFDCSIDIAIMGLIEGEDGDETTGIEVSAVQKDNSNNIRWGRVHIEGAYGKYCTLIKSRKPLQLGNYHHTFSFEALHLESRRFDAINFDIEGLTSSVFGSIHFISNNTNGGDTTIADARRIIRMKDSFDNKFLSGVVIRTEGPHTSPLPPIHLTGDVKGSEFSIRLISGSSNDSSIDSFITNESTDPLFIANSFDGATFGNFDTSVLVKSMLKLSCMKSVNRAHFLTVAEDGTLVNSFSNASNGLTKTDIMKLTAEGDLAPGSLCTRPVLTLAAGASTTYVLPNQSGQNANKRGLVTLIAKHNTVLGNAIFTSSGTSLLEHINGGLYKISTATGNVSGFVNISLSSGNLLIQNLTATQVVIGVLFTTSLS